MDTRDRILDAAERLFAERGVSAVSNRQVGEAAGQGNTAAVNYHFGTKAELVRAVVARHSAHVERIRRGMLDALPRDASLRERVGCVVLPFTRHLAEQGGTTWYARVVAQVLTDPAWRVVVDPDLAASPTRSAAVEGLPRIALARHLIVHTCAEHETRPDVDWAAVGQELVDAITAMARTSARPASRSHRARPR